LQFKLYHYVLKLIWMIIAIGKPHSDKTVYQDLGLAWHRWYNGRAMRIVLGGFVLLAANLANPQSSSELRSHYGAPDIERFIVRPGIGLTVEYGSDGLACEMLIEPPLPLFHGDEQTLYMSSDAVTSVLDDVVPVGMRGLEIANSISEMGRNRYELAQYENVSIGRSTDTGVPLKPEREMRANVIFKRDVCRVLSKQLKSAS
jgi:hypothetical protein